MAVFTTALIGGLLGVASTSLLAGVSTLALNVAVGVGLSLAAQAIAGKPKEAPFSINGKLQAGGDIARSFIFGHTTTAGSLVYANTWGDGGKTPNEYFTQVIAISDTPIVGITQLWVNGEPVTIDPTLDPDDKGNQIAEYRKGSDNHLWIRFHDGTQTAPDSLLTNKVSSGSHPWDPTRIGTGVAYAVITAEVNAEFFTGFPSFKFEVQGARLYDPSRDSTVGGSGTHRFDTPSTWGGDGDDLPAVQIYNLLRGVQYNAGWLYGLQGLTEARVPVAHWIAQINKCRALIAGPDGNEAQYLTGGEIHLSAQIADAIEALLTGCQGRLSESGGVYKIYVGEPDAAVMAFTDGDILSTEEQTFTPFFGLSDTINGINATYPEPAEGWNSKTAPALYNSTFEAEDGNRRLMSDVQMDMVYRSSQVQRLMKSALLEARRARRHTLVLPPQFWVLEPGDVIIWNSERNGYVDKLFRVDGVADKANLDVTIDITEVDPTDYDWDQDHDYTPPVFSPVGPVKPAPQPIIDWSAVGDVVNDNNGNPRRPAILLSWDGDQADVVGVEFEVRLATSLATVYGGRTDQPEVGSILISQGLLPNTLYGVRGRYIPGTPRECEWSAWLPATTPNVLLGSEDVYAQDIVDQINAENAAHELWIAESLHYARDELDRLNTLAAETGAQSTTDKFEMLATVGSFSASFTQQITVVATATQAAVIRVEDLEAQIDDPVTGLSALGSVVSTLSTSVTAIDGQLTVVSNSVLAVSAQVGSISGSGLFRVGVTATEAGSLSTIGLSAIATAGGVATSASIFISANSDGTSSVSVLAQRFSISDGTNDEFPFIFSGGVAVMNATRVNTITAGMLRSSDSKMQVDLTNRRILIAD